MLMLGGTMIEREQEFGNWEAAVRQADATHRYRIRNLAWSGDTVWAESRGRFDPPKVAYKRLIDEAASVQPTHMLFGYGTAEAYGAHMPDEFEAQLRQLVADLPDADRVFLGTSRVGLAALPEDRRRSQAERLDAFDAVIQRVASDLAAPFVPVSDFVGTDLTDDRMHWNMAGYAASAGAIAGAFTNAELETPSDELLAAIRRKNRLVFHRYRPQNTTYLLLFRKHEQGQNAAEIPKFDPAIAAADDAIAALLRSAR